MNRGRTLACAAIGAGLAATSALAWGQAKAAGGPAATYWMTAETVSGMAAMGQSGRGMIGALLSGRAPGGVVHTLQLQLGSTRKAAGTPQAEHVPPAALRAGASLPLATPDRPRPASGATDWTGGRFERPRGRMLIYWGCGEKAGPGQPVVIDFAKLSAGQVPPGFNSLNVKGMTPPAPGSSTTYGEWPNARSKVTVPANGSLVGEHVVRGNYTPEIRFALSANQDFLGPLNPASQPAASGAMMLNWRSVPNARAYMAMVMGAGQDETMVMWSSSSSQMMGMGIPDYMPEAELQRLVSNRVLMGPAATSCAVPSEVVRATQGAMLMMTAFGPHSDFSYPPRPTNAPKGWAPEWVAKLRSKSTHMSLLGMEMPGMGSQTAADEPGETPQPRKKKRGGILGKIGEAVGGQIP